MNTEASKSSDKYKKSKRAYINLDHNGGSLRSDIKALLVELNTNKDGIEPKANLNHVVSYMIKRLTEADITKIRQSSYETKDLFELERVKYNEKNNLSLSMEEFFAIKLKIRH